MWINISAPAYLIGFSFIANEIGKPLQFDAQIASPSHLNIAHMYVEIDLLTPCTNSV